MNNPLVDIVEHNLGALGMSEAILEHESYDPKNFGNAEAIYKLGNLHFRFIRDRSHDFVSIGSSVSPRHFFNIEDVAVWMGWIDFEELHNYDTPLDFSKPPPGPILKLTRVLSLVLKDVVKLNEAFSSDKLMSTRAELKEIAHRRLSAT
ncbi:MAG: hypothetical protein ACYC5A_11220 [Thermoleophilia bacterium]